MNELKRKYEKGKRPKKNKVVQFALTNEDFELLTQEAKEQNLSTSAFMRRLYIDRKITNIPQAPKIAQTLHEIHMRLNELSSEVDINELQDAISLLSLDLLNQQKYIERYRY